MALAQCAAPRYAFGMLRFAANLSMLWPDLPFLDRFDAAAQAGFEGVEVLFPYDVPAKETQDALAANGLSFVLLNAPGPNYTGSDERGYAAVPELKKRFAYDLRRAFRYAEALGAEVLHIMAGAASGAEAHACFVQNLKAAAAQAPDGLTLTIEPLNQGGMPGYFLNDFDQACAILDEVGAVNLGLQYDCFHAAQIHGDPLEVYHRCRSYIRHIQIGDAPGRTAPGTGTIDFPALFAAIADSGYTGWVSAEFHPEGRTDKQLDWMAQGQSALR